MIHSIDMENKQLIGEILAENLSQLMATSSTLNTYAKVAKRSGIGKGTVERISKYQVSTSISNLEALAEAFNVSVASLITKGAITEKPTYHPEIEAVVSLMLKTDDHGKVRVRYAVEDAMAQYSLNKRIIDNSDQDIEIAIAGIKDPVKRNVLQQTLDAIKSTSSESTTPTFKKSA
ncbi:helix-turn-helix domain-containing protein [Undibacterium sp. MH2W]|uniref:helix-turn-helix domain-containing protein n=1 Tax=Undibacterium sp. MH2W TaxID=3413044 RepID=UPI003BF24AE0